MADAMNEPRNLIELIGQQALIRQHPEWEQMRLWYTAEPFRQTTWRLMHWYRVTL
jgi:5-methylcytosine-specific restriction endonuclease McrBC GTP-binding regulatory subunit McrB